MLQNSALKNPNTMITLQTLQRNNEDLETSTDQPSLIGVEFAQFMLCHGFVIAIVEPTLPSCGLGNHW